MPVIKKQEATRPGRPMVYGDPFIAWGAKLIQPNRAVKDSEQDFIVEVSAPVTLEDSVYIQVGGQRAAAQWQGERSQVRLATAVLGVQTVGRHKVYVQVNTGSTKPNLEAGVLIVTAGT